MANDIKAKMRALRRSLKSARNPILFYLDDAEYDGRVKTQTLKQFHLERLIKVGTVIPASKLAQAKELELQRARDFEAAAVDEERHSRTANPPPADKLDTQPLTRERFEE